MGLSARLLQIFRQLWTSYWCIPVAILIAALLLAAATTWFDQRFAGHIALGIFNFQPIQPETARLVLSMIAGSIIGVAGVLFSITMVAVSFASGTFGPRLIGNMMRDRGSQVCLGIFIGTFSYTLIVLRFVQSGGYEGITGDTLQAFTPYISTGMSMALALVCMVVLIYFIHHVPETINIELIVAKLGRALKSGIKNRFPEHLRHRDDATADGPHWIEEVEADDAVSITLGSDGYIQAMDIDRLDRLAGRGGFRIEILGRPGRFVSTADSVLAVWSDGETDDRALEELRACVAVGAEPTVNQNIEFIANQLVEIIARALSPGMNDPFTAIACVNWLNVGLQHFAARDGLADSFNRNERVYAAPYRFPDFVSDIFDKALPYVIMDVNVTRHTVDLLTSTADLLPPGKNREAVERVIRVLRHSPDRPDRSPPLE